MDLKRLKSSFKDKDENEIPTIYKEDKDLGSYNSYNNYNSNPSSSYNNFEEPYYNDQNNNSYNNQFEGQYSNDRNRRNRDRQNVNININNYNNNSYNYNNYANNANYSYVRKRKLSALLLCLFLGVLGIHRFYLGKNVTGFLYLISGGIFGLGIIMDLILIVTGSLRDASGAPLE